MSSLKYRINFDIDKFIMLRYAERFLYLSKQMNHNPTKKNFDIYVKDQLLKFGTENELEVYADYTRQSIIFLIKKYKLNFF